MSEREKGKAHLPCRQGTTLLTILPAEEQQSGKLLTSHIFRYDVRMCPSLDSTPRPELPQVNIRVPYLWDSTSSVQLYELTG